MRRFALAIVPVALSACAQTLGAEPTLGQLRFAVDQREGWRTLETVNCEGRAECYSAAFGNVEVRNAQCAAQGAGRAECEYEFRANSGDEWERGRAKLRIGTALDGKQRWLIEPNEEI